MVFDLDSNDLVGKIIEDGIFVYGILIINDYLIDSDIEIVILIVFSIEV